MIVPRRIVYTLALKDTDYKTLQARCLQRTRKKALTSLFIATVYGMPGTHPKTICVREAHLDKPA